ncbi:hypothetical protein NP493_1519g00032 [Ridgeia piscesae]|uniref:G-protein coupled receptors family 3 profile domain-containing protein n=1 Tax=Ridgeia piscesae TaxID=27915 RepID=A0AAD9NBV1_RIDPI|nr:hypothetical protein NP493_1519g00032 [Ridgeia piscesae]
MDIDQCANGSGAFANTHHCRETTECRPVSGMGLQRGAYRCHCLPGFYMPSSTNSHDGFFSGLEVERSYLARQLNISDGYDRSFQCRPCAQGCLNCSSDSACFAEYDVVLRCIPLGIQSFCITVAAVVAFVIARMRKTKVIKSSMWVLLECIILGSLLLYSTVIVQYFAPTCVTCLLVPWLREVGFAIVYGGLILKIYRILAEFQSRKAHRVEIRDKDLVVYLCAIVVVVVGYMAAWTAVTMDNLKDDETMLELGLTSDNLQYYSCISHWWNYVIETGEFLFLCYGIYWCYCIRAAPSDYREAKYISWAIYNETIVSATFHIIRHFVWLTIHPDYLFLMCFLRCQITVTVTLLLVIGPKLWYTHRPPETTYRNRTYSGDVHDNILPESLKLRTAINSNGDVDVGEINLSEMDPEDIRSELKRLYTQLQIYKTKAMRKDNPHISKRRGGRKQTHRRFSLQAFHHKHKYHHEPRSDFDHELSKTPEESTNSAEGVAISMAEESSIGECRTPTVTFKPGHKSMY